MEMDFIPRTSRRREVYTQRGDRQRFPCEPRVVGGANYCCLLKHGANKSTVETGWCELISKFKALKPTTFDLS